MIQTLLHAALVNALLAMVLAGIVALLAWLLRGRPAVVHVLWLLVLLKFITPPLLPLSLPWPEPAPPPPDPVEEEQVRLECPRVAEEPVRVAPALPMPEAPPAEPAPEPELAEPAGRAAPKWPELIASVWLAGALVCWSVAGVRLWRLYRALRGLPPAAEAVQQRIGRLAERLGLRRCPQAWLLPGVLPPMLLALGRSAWLLLPGELWHRLDEAQRDTLLLHELAHLKRGDHRVRWLEVLVLGLYWWHPVAWWASRALRDAEEQCCDAWVVWALPRAAQAYAMTLVETIAWLSRPPVVLPAGASGAGPVRLLKRRLTMILRGRTPRCLSWPALAVVLVCGVGLLPLMPTMARSGPPEAVAEKDPFAPGEKPSNKQLIEQKACIACHQPSRPQAKKGDPGKLHAEVVRLLDERAALRKKLGETEKKLRDALLRFEKAQGGKVPAPPTGDRLESIEKKLKLLLDEVEGLRREMRKAKEAPTGKNQGGPLYLNKRSMSIPFNIKPNTNARGLLLYMTPDGGQSFQLVARATADQNPVAFSFVAPANGTYGFLLATVDKDGKQSPGEITGRLPMLTVIIDTLPPTVTLLDSPGLFEPGIRWLVEDDNLALETLRCEVRKPGAKWMPLNIPQQARGQLSLHRDCRGDEIRLTVSDKAGNTTSKTLTLSVAR